VYTGEYTTMALCGFIRSQGESDGALDRLFGKRLEDAKRAGIII
jgi:small subunit ribosomal protein S21e